MRNNERAARLESKQRPGCAKGLSAPQILSSPNQAARTVLSAADFAATSDDIEGLE